jgi:hypothetical protein
LGRQGDSTNDDKGERAITMKRPLFKLGIGLAFLFGLTQLSYLWKETTHKDNLTNMALDLIKKADGIRYGPEIWDQEKGFREFILQGAHDEDFPCDALPSAIRANNHYRHALTGVGLTGSLLGLGDTDVDTLTWAKINPNFSPKEEFGNGKDWAGFKKWEWSLVDVDGGNMSWEKAIARYDYTESSKRLAYYTLGFITHLLEDMGEPEHVHDDPHGDSGYSGFENWVQSHWETLKPGIGPLKVKRFADQDHEQPTETIDDYFINLSKIGYSAGRFPGKGLSATPPHIDLDCGLAKMFEVGFRREPISDPQGRFVRNFEEWYLKNRNGLRIIQGGDDFGNAFFSYNASAMLSSPHLVKGLFEGDWWPTDMEIPAKVTGDQTDAKNDVPGFYYLELSDESPIKGLERRLYPDAFLPEPLEDVRDECRGWAISDVKSRYAKEEERHLYSLTGRAVIPPTVEYAAGLIELYYDTVNHPPYVKQVEIRQNDELKYSRGWKDEEKYAGIPGFVTIQKVIKRSQENDPNKPDEELTAGFAVIKVEFSEPVRDVTVKLGDRIVQGLNESVGTLWTGAAEIPADNSLAGIQTLSVAAKDWNRHYQGKGTDLDGDPSSPALRTSRRGAEKKWPNGALRDVELSYDWKGYEAAPDSHYRVSVKKKPMFEAKKRMFWLVHHGGAHAMLDIMDGTREQVERQRVAIVDGPYECFVRDEALQEFCKNVKNKRYDLYDGYLGTYKDDPYVYNIGRLGGCGLRHQS